MNQLNIEELTRHFEGLLRAAQQGEPMPNVDPRRLIEAIQVAYDAIRARERLQADEPIPPRWLAALANVATSRVKNVIRARGLVRTTSGVNAESARRWLAREAERRVRTRKSQWIATEPSWWRRCPNPTLAFMSLIRVAEQALPDGLTFMLDPWNTPCFHVPPHSTLDHDEIETLRKRVRDVLEPLEAVESWPQLPADDDEPSSP